MAIKKLSNAELKKRADENGLATLTNAQLEQLSTSGLVNPEDVESALNTRLKIARIKTANRGPGRPSRRELQEKAGDGEWMREQQDRIDRLSVEEAEDELAHILSPAHNDLKTIFRLQRIVDAGGKAGSDAARLIFEIQKRYLPANKRVCTVKIQTAG